MQAGNLWNPKHKTKISNVNRTFFYNEQVVHDRWETNVGKRLKMTTIISFIIIEM